MRRLLAVDFENLNLDLLARGDDLAGVDVLLDPAHLGDVDQAFDARLQLDESAVVRDVGDRSLELAADRILRLDAGPWVGAELLHAEADALRLRIDADDLHLHRVADVQDLGRMVDALPRHVGDVKQAIDAAEVDECAVVGDVLHHAVDNLALFELGDDLGALLGARLFKHGAAGNDDIAAPAIHLQDLEGLRHVHEGRHVLDRAGYRPGCRAGTQRRRRDRR